MEYFMGSSDDERRDWLQNFATRVSSSASTYQISAADVLTIVTSVQAFVTALQVSRTAETRTSATIAQKNDARDAASAVCRQYAILMKYNGGISADDLILAGIKPPTHSSTPVNVPVASPALVLQAGTNGAHTLGYVSSLDPSDRAKPVGAVALQLYRAVAEEPVSDWRLAQHYGIYTKTPMVSLFEPADNGKVATYFARWSSRRGQFSNWSDGVSMTIAA